MTYDPFARGEFPVGVRTIQVYDADRDRTLPTEIWYPADAHHRGQDLDDTQKDTYEALPNSPPSFQAAVRDADPSPGDPTPVVFSHSVASHRRQSTYLCTHLASHGYLVAAPDHVGNTLGDLMEAFLAGPGEGELLDIIIRSGLDRPRDLRAVLDDLGAVHPLGTMGHGFGGWTALSVAGDDERVGAAVPLSPGGGEAGALPGIDLRETLDLEWDRPIPTLFLAAEEDSLVRLSGVRNLYERNPSAERLAILRNADHWHFCDSVEDIHDLMLSLGPGLGIEGMRPSFELCPGEQAHAFSTALTLAHLDAALREDDRARAFLEQDLVALFAERGTEVVVERR